MIPVYQDKFGPNGNCLSAAVASIFELKLSEVPYFAEAPGNENGDWFRKLYEFCQTLGYNVTPYYRPIEDWNNLPEHLKDSYVYYLQCGLAARGYQHATVGYRGKVMHDPHPDKSGLVRTDDYYFFSKILK